MSLRSFDESVRLLHDRINLERLQSFTPQDLEGRLDSLRNILDSLGNPETAYRTVHITGTKGKGSTCIMLESILREEGWRVGRFTSPHLYSFTERLMIDGTACSPDDFAELFFSVYERIEPNTFQSLTYFEVLTLLAFVHFAQKQVDVAIFEVGLGGRLDATNLCQPDVSVITSISFDHMLQLGPTLADIAREKSGIIKPGAPVVTTVLLSEPQEVIRDKTNSLGLPLFVLDEHFFVLCRNHPYPSNGGEILQYTFQYKTSPQFPVKLTLDGLSLKMPGAHQIDNAAAAISAFLLLHQAGKPLDTESILRGLRKASIPLRVEVFRPSDGSPTFVFDGAHNRSSMQAFVKTVTELFPHRRLLLIFGASLGKDVEGMFAEIAGRFQHIFLTQCSESNRRFPPQELRAMLEDTPETSIAVVDDCQVAWKQCERMAEAEDVISVTGSLYLAAELRKYFLEHFNMDDNRPQGFYR